MPEIPINPAVARRQIVTAITREGFDLVSNSRA
jgi:hypothetical protein